ncbi:MAG: hypothetical protein ACPGTO_08925 [Polaribacter sp.]
MCEELEAGSGELDIETAYKHTLEFRNIYENTDKVMAKERFEKWIEDTF